MITHWSGVTGGPSTLSTGRERTGAFVAAMREHGLDLPPAYVEEGDFQAASGRASAARLLDLAHPPDVIFAGDNLMTLGAMEEIKSRGLRIPHDVGLVSFDDAPWFTLVDPPITVIAQPTEEMGRRAVRVMLDLIRTGAAQSVTLSARLVTRGSCGEGGEA